MKKFITALFAFALVFVANAQVITLAGPYGNTTDSITNAGNNYVYAKIAGGGSVTIQAVITKISGTAAGTAILQGSVDGTNWVTIHYEAGANYGASSTARPNDTVTITNVTSQTCAWYLSENQYLYYRVYVVGSGTMLVTLSAQGFIRKDQ